MKHIQNEKGFMFGLFLIVLVVLILIELIAPFGGGW